jgi:hypothetical protein
MRDEAPEIPKYGGYRKLKSYRMAQLIVEVTAQFCDLYVEEDSRILDRMMEAAQGAAQKIAGGSLEGENSKKSEMKLTKQARVLLEELHRDFGAFLRQHELPVWDAADTRRADLIAGRPRSVDDVAEWMRRVEQHQGGDGRDGPGGQRIATPSEASGMSIPFIQGPEILANGILVLISMATALIDRQVSAQVRVVQHEERVAEQLRRRRLEEWPG